MPPACDQYADPNGVELARLAKLYAFPDFVKSASVERVLTPQEHPPHIYADPVHRQFPCHSAAATWLSGLYFEEKQAEYHPKDQKLIRQRLNGFVSFHGIRPAYDQMVARHAELYKTADDQLPDSAFALVWADDTGAKQRDYPLRNAKEVQAAARWLHEYRDHWPFAGRHVIATKILEKAAQFGASLAGLEEFMEKQAGRGVCDPAEVQAMIRDRALLAQGEERAGIEKLAETFNKMSRLHFVPEVLIKLAETMDTIDRGLGLTGKYTERIKRPEDVLFKATFTKAAAELANHCQLQTGTIYSKDTLAKVALDDVQSLFGQDFAQQVRRGLDIDPEKLAAVASTLPRPDAQLFDAMMNDVGLHPQAEKAAAAPAVDWTDREWAALASEYGVR